jgi:hypothetical protein
MARNRTAGEAFVRNECSRESHTRRQSRYQPALFPATPDDSKAGYLAHRLVLFNVHSRMAELFLRRFDVVSPWRTFVSTGAHCCPRLPVHQEQVDD